MEAYRNSLNSIIESVNSKITTLNENKQQMKQVFANFNTLNKDDKHMAKEFYTAAFEKNQSEIKRQKSVLKEINNQLKLADEREKDINKILDFTGDLLSVRHLINYDIKEINRMLFIIDSAFLNDQQKLKMISGNPLLEKN